MVQINFARKEVNCKIVYYGPGLSGKTTNLEIVHEKAPPDRKGDLTSIATEGDRTLFFDFMPLELGKVGGMNTKFQLYTVPGQVYYNATRKLVLQGADGVVFVADSQREKLEENLESFKNLEDNLREQGLDLKKLPMVMQYNKRDLPSALPVADLDKAMNKYAAPTIEAVAVTGEGVFPTLKKLASMVLDNLNKQYGVGAKPAGPPPKAGAKDGKADSGEIPKEAPPERERVGVAAGAGAGARAQTAGGGVPGEGSTPGRGKIQRESALSSAGTDAPARPAGREATGREAPLRRPEPAAGGGAPAAARGGGRGAAEKSSEIARERGEERERRGPASVGRPGGGGGSKQPQVIVAGDKKKEAAGGGPSAMVILLGIVLAIVAVLGVLWYTGILDEILGTATGGR